LQSGKGAFRAIVETKKVGCFSERGVGYVGDLRRRSKANAGRSYMYIVGLSQDLIVQAPETVESERTVGKEILRRPEIEQKSDRHKEEEPWEQGPEAN
jgi:hypothetical protein